MRDIFWNWRFYKGELMLENNILKSTIPQRKTIPTKKSIMTKDDPIPEYARYWAEKRGYVFLQTSSNLSGLLGRGEQGAVFSMDKDGKEYAVKFSTPFGIKASNEINLMKNIKAIQDREPIIKKHTVNIKDVDQFKWKVFNPETRQEQEEDINVFSVERLEPLNSAEKLAFQGDSIFTGASVASKNVFLNNIFFEKGYNPEWQSIRKEFSKNISNLIPKLIASKYKNYLYRKSKMQSLQEAQQEDMIENLMELLLFAFDKARELPQIKNILNDKNMYVDLGEGPIVRFKEFSEAYKMLMFKDTEFGKTFSNKILKMFDNMPGQENKNDAIKNIVGDALNSIQNNIKVALEQTFKDVFTTNIPWSYRDDQQKDIEKIKYQQAGPIRSLNNALLTLRDKYGIVAFDLHDKNVMKRGGDYVVSDLGLFRNKGDVPQQKQQDKTI